MSGTLTPERLTAVVFLDVAVIIVLAQLVGALFRRLGQPAVVGEIVTGVILGPTVLGALPGDLPGRIFLPEARPLLNILAQLGLVTFMFTVGVDLDLVLVRGRSRVAGLVSMCSIVVPFAAGILLALSLHASHRAAPHARGLLPFALFIGTSMSITAFPVLACILKERGLYFTEVGALTLVCAAVDDVAAWTILAVVLAIVNASGLSHVLLVVVESLVFVAVLFRMVGPALKRLLERPRPDEGPSGTAHAIALSGFLLCAFVTSAIGIHAIFGAFLYGVVLQEHAPPQLLADVRERLTPVSRLLLLPVFFIVTGLNVDVRHLGSQALTQLPLILVVAVAGKFLGASLAAWAQGLERRKAAIIGVLMNTRGLTELVILNAGREAGVLDVRLFSMLVVMAIVTTVMTGPLLSRLLPKREPSDPRLLRCATAARIRFPSGASVVQRTGQRKGKAISGDAGADKPR